VERKEKKKKKKKLEILVVLMQIRERNVVRPMSWIQCSCLHRVKELNKWLE
jgi:hypothetical protein